MRFVPFSYFCTRWKVRSSASPSISWLIPSIMRRMRTRLPTLVSVGCAPFFGIVPPVPLAALESRYTTLPCVWKGDDASAGCDDGGGRCRCVGQAALGSSGLVLISVVPHCTQLWVTSSRSFDSAPLASCAGPTAEIAIRCPQCGQGRRKLGRREGATSLKCMGSLPVPRPPASAAAIPRSIYRSVNEDLCDAYNLRITT